MKRVIVLIGNYGSGKTEIALNLALKAAREGKSVALVDLDIVNPYFRSAEQTNLLRESGVRLIAPPYASTNVDLPVLSAEVQRVFVEPLDQVIFDVGGDAVGATALGQYHAKFAKIRQDVEVLAVINTKRPLCGTPSDIATLLSHMSAGARLEIDGIINNANLARDTSAQLLVESEEILKEVTKRTGIPVTYVGGLPEVLNQYAELSCKSNQTSDSPEHIEIHVYTRPDWLDITIE
ncbi:MAG: cobalamin biosynthesis protein CobQ [Christensenellales bacterium]|jgi:hypothetical protein